MKTLISSFLFSFVFIFSASSSSAGYQPTATVTQGTTSISIKNYMQKLGIASVDTLAKVFPAVPTGIKLASSTVGSVASSVYSGSAAIASKVFFSPLKGANIAIDLVSNIPKAKLVSGALAVLRNPVLAGALLAGSALYSWMELSGMVISDGQLMSASGLVRSVENAAAYDQCQAYLTANVNDPTYYWVCYDEPQYSRFLLAKYRKSNNEYLNSTPYSYSATCPSGQTLVNGYCDTGVPSPITDSDATQKLLDTTPADPASVLSDIVDNGVTPDNDSPIATAPSSTPISTTVTTNPDNSTSTVEDFITASCIGDTCIITNTQTKTDKDIAGTTTGVTTKTEAPPLIDNGAIPASDTPNSQFDDTDIIAAIDAAKVQAQTDHAALLSEIQAVPDHVLNDEPVSLPIIPPIEPDTDQYFNFLNTTNPYSWNISSFLPSLPSSDCIYEIHRTFFGRAFDFAPCEKLQPLRVVFAWAFSVLTLWSCFLVVFGAKW